MRERREGEEEGENRREGGGERGREGGSRRKKGGGRKGEEEEGGVEGSCHIATSRKYVTYMNCCICSMHALSKDINLQYTSMSHTYSLKCGPRCYTKSPTAQDMFRPHASVWVYISANVKY